VTHDCDDTLAGCTSDCTSDVDGDLLPDCGDTARIAAFYPFDGDANDAGTAGNDPTYVHNISYGTGHDGQAAVFDGSGYIDIPVDIGASSAPEITFGAWVDAGADSQRQAILSHDNCCFDRQLGIDNRTMDGGTAGWSWAAFAGDYGNEVLNSGAEIKTDGSWQFVAVRYDGSEVTLFVDDQAFVANDRTADGESLARIGGNPNYDHYFQGKIDNLFLYTDALTDTEIRHIRDFGAATLTCPVFDADADGVLCAADCDEADAAVGLPGAAEINDGSDNQCPGDAGRGLVDEISDVAGFNTLDDKTRFSWTSQNGAVSYEVARSTTPDFSSGCATLTRAESYWIDAAEPAQSECFHYLVRALAPFTGSWGAGSEGMERTTVCP